MNFTDPSGLDNCQNALRGGQGSSCDEILVVGTRLTDICQMPGTFCNPSSGFLDALRNSLPSGGGWVLGGNANQTAPTPQSGHDYSVYGTICARALNASEMRDILSRFSLPGHSGEVATDGNYTVYQWDLPGGRVNVDFADNGLSVRNTTLNPHIFAGQIDRRIYSGRFGTFTTTHGTGAAQFLGRARDWLNGKLGPGIFEGLNEAAAAYAKQNFKGC